VNGLEKIALVEYEQVSPSQSIAESILTGIFSQSALMNPIHVQQYGSIFTWLACGASHL
jgi:hypothetical protein